jgi:hypothetical protein
MRWSIVLSTSTKEWPQVKDASCRHIEIEPAMHLDVATRLAEGMADTFRGGGEPSLWLPSSDDLMMIAEVLQSVHGYVVTWNTTGTRITLLQDAQAA